MKLACWGQGCPRGQPSHAVGRAVLLIPEIVDFSTKTSDRWERGFHWCGSTYLVGGPAALWTMKFKGTFRAVRLDLPKYQKILHEQLTDAITEAAAEWLGAVVRKVPVWSGASAATFLPLARAVSYPLTVQPLHNSRGSRVSLGLNHADGSLNVDPASGKYTFTYSTTLAHLIWNEFNNANINPDPTKWPPPAKLIEPGPYGFQKLGQDAFERHAAGVALPNPFQSLTVKTIRVK